MSLLTSKEKYGMEIVLFMYRMILLLDRVEMISIYEVLTEILELWGTNPVTISTPGKNGKPAPAK